MKKSLMAVALVGAFAGVAQAQTAVQIYGTVDLGIIKQSDKTMAIGKRAPNTLGFKGTEELGNGLKALFQLEMRYDSDTGTMDNNDSRPLFQGQSRVGLQGDFGMVRIGRGPTAYQDVVGAFEPWRGIATPSGYYTDLALAGYTSQPLDKAGSSGNRWSNAFWYNSPVINGFQLNATIATKEAGNGGSLAPLYPVAAEASVNPFSVAATYNNGPAAILLAYERNAVESKVMSIGTTLFVLPELKLSLLATRQDQGHTAFISPTIYGKKTNSWVAGANYFMGANKFLIGYGKKTPDNYAKTTQLSLGYEYSLSKRTYLYVDASRKNGAQTQFGIVRNNKYYDMGINHSF